MRKVFQISVLLLLYLLITAKSCDNQEQADDNLDQTRIKLTQDSVRSTFEADTLSPTSLVAFEVMAKIKLSDFSDYLSIIYDTSVAGTFREKAREMIHMLFISENSLLLFTNPDNLTGKEVTVKQLLDSGKKGSFKFGRIIKDSIRITQTTHRISDSAYIGKLSFSYIPGGQKSEESLEEVAANGTIGFLVIKHKKYFGKDALRIWDVFLGNPE